MVNKTAEIRWWSSEKTKMWSWFQKNIWKSHEGEPEERTDYYFKTIGEGSGIKWREGNLEFKFRTSKCDLAVGALEVYVKESLPSELALIDLPTHEMVAVAKTRYKRITHPGRGFIQEGDTTIDAGCQMEYTEVKFDERQVLHTIGFEAFDENGGEVELLRKTLEYFSLTEEFFSKENSAGYVAKIKELTSKK